MLDISFDHRRSGFTLLELLLSLAVLSVLAALVLPSMDGLLSDRRLQRAGDLVQIEMSRARLDAMRSGRVLVLSAAPGASTLQIGPYFLASDATESSDGGGGVSALLAGAEQAAIVPIDFDIDAGRTIELPDEITVGSVQVAHGTRALAMQTDPIAGAAPVGDESSVGTVAGNQVFFYPDGSTSDAVIQIASPTDGEIMVLIRGVTGQTLVSQAVGP